MPSLPLPRGPVSDRVVAALRDGGLTGAAPPPPDDVVGDGDLQLALYCLYELHYRGFDGVDDELEWDADLLAERRRLERAFETALFERVGPPGEGAAPEEMDLALRAVAASDDGPDIARFVAAHATLDQVRDLLVLKSPYQLKEADPHSFGLPRLYGPPKAAMVEIQTDEYGGGKPHRIHADLFATTMTELGLDGTYGAYLDRVPALSLASVNLMSLMGLHRRWRGGIVGHLALVEMTSSVPSGLYARGLRRLGAPEAAIDFFDEHVVADAVHEHIAAVDLAGGLARQQPAVAGDILWGARASVEVDGRAARATMDAWDAGVSPLLEPAEAHSAP